MVGPLEVEAQHGNAPAINNGRIDFKERVLVRNHLASAGEAHGRSVIAATVVLEGLAVSAARWISVDAPASAQTRHAAAAAKLDVIAARETELRVVEPPRHIEMCAACAVLVMRMAVHHRGYEPAHAGAGRISQVLTNHAARVRKALRELSRSRIEQQSRRLAGT